MPTLEELQAQNEQLQRQINELMLRSAPADQRAIIAQRQEVERERAALAAERATLTSAALEIRKRETVQQWGVTYDVVKDASSLDEVNAAVLTHMQQNLNDPAALRKFADFIEQRTQAGVSTPPQVGPDGQPIPPTPGAAPAAAAANSAPAAAATAAPGIAAAPASAGGPSGGTTAIGPDPSAAITERYKGKGMGDLAQWLTEERMVPPVDYRLGAGSGEPTPLPGIPASAAPNPAGAPAGVPAAATP